MNRIILILLIPVVFLSCAKDAVSVGFENYYNKQLICDSIRTKTGTTNNVQVLGEGKGFDLLFTAGANTGGYRSTAGTFQQFSTPAVKMNFRFEPADKLYYWPLNSTKEEGDFYNVITASGRNVTLQHIVLGRDEETYYYYTVK